MVENQFLWLMVLQVMVELLYIIQRDHCVLAMKFFWFLGGVLSELRHTEIGSAIEYVVKALKVENILVIRHSRCGGIKRLMKLPNESYTYDFIDQWVQIGLPAKIKVLEEANHLPFEEQCRLCEKVKSQAAPTCSVIKLRKDMFHGRPSN
ncbi:hypothetical protein POUND7_006400 [Theobroma cacao]